MFPVRVRLPLRRMDILFCGIFAAVAAASSISVFGAQDSGPGRDAWQRPEEVMTALHLGPGSRVADVGAGSGYFVRHLSRRVGEAGRVFAVDVDENELRRLARKLKEESVSNVDIITGATDNPHLPAASLDVVLVVNAYHEMREPDAMMRGFFGALKPGGLLAIIDAVGDDSRSRDSHFSSHTIPASIVRADADRARFQFLREEPGFKRPDGSRHDWFFLIFRKPLTDPI